MTFAKLKAEQIFINSQSERRAYSDRLMKIQSDLTSIRLEMEKFPRSDDRYLELFQKEHNLIKEEKLVQHQLKQHENQERQLFASFQLALRQSQEKEKMRVERTKYWSLIGSIVGTLLGIIGKKISSIPLFSNNCNFLVRCNNIESLSYARIPSSP